MPFAVVTAIPHLAPDGDTHILVICPKRVDGRCDHGAELRHARFELPVGCDREAFMEEAVAEAERMFRLGRLKKTRA